MHTRGADQWSIANALNVTQGRVSQLIAEAARSHPVVALSYEERCALSETKWNQSEQEIIDEIANQRRNGRRVVETITFSDGTKQQKVTETAGVDPAHCCAA